MPADPEKLVERLCGVLNRRNGLYRELGNVTSFGEYLKAKPSREDEETLTEPVLADLMHELLGFPVDSFLPQFSKGGLKPDLTPMDLIAHSFVLDAKSSLQDLDKHESQIRTYIDQRRLDYGILFNLREFRVYRRGASGHEDGLSFRLGPLWEGSSGHAFAISTEREALAKFVAQFGYREMALADKVEEIGKAAPWSEKDLEGEVEVDIDHLVERLRDLAHLLTEDAIAQPDALRSHLSFNPGREAVILGELAALAQDLDPGTASAALPGDVEGYLSATEGLARRVWLQYLTRVAQLALARTMLYRSWEDVGFVDEHLYDGGFNQAYDQFDSDLRKILTQAFAEGLQRYPWLYGKDNNYDWYRPRDSALADVLYGLIPFPLGKLDADVLGGLYESYVDEIDRDRLGQFYTPRVVVRFMLERAGFEGADGVFDLEGDERKPKQILDFATGSGGFLVEAARRIIDRGGLDLKDPTDLADGLKAIVNGIHGCEISPFPYYLTEINLLLQVSRLLGAMTLAGSGQPSSFALGAVHADTLTTRPASDVALSGLTSAQQQDVTELAQDDHFALVPLDHEKQQAFDRVRQDQSFDLVVGNPPYVFETNNKLLFDRLRQIPAWKGIYQGKSDYLYYFLQLAVEKLKPGGRLAVIVPAGWMNAGNAAWLRDFMASNLRLDELFLFGGMRLFAPEREARGRRLRAPTPTVESAILIATKGEAPTNHKLRVAILDDEVEAAKALSPEPDAISPDRERVLGEMAERIGGRAGRKRGIHVHRVAQADLVTDRPWPVKHSKRDVAAKVVAHLQKALDSKLAPVERLAERWELAQGIQTGADAYSPRIRKRLEASFPDALAEQEHRGATLGEPIMELPAGMESEIPWSGNPGVLARSIEPTAILYGAMDETEYTSLVWLGREDTAPPDVVKALEKWKPVLSHRAEFMRNPGRRWWETAWPREKEGLRRPKVIALYRTDRGRFAFDEAGDWQPSIKTTLAIGKRDDLSVVYLCGLLNSELLDLWYGVRGKTPRDVWRNYEPKPMAEIPYRHVGAAGSPDDARLETLDSALAGSDATAAFGLADQIGQALRDEAEGAERSATAALERLVRAIAANRSSLLPHREAFSGLARIVKDPWAVGPVVPARAALVAALPKSDMISVRIDPELSLSFDSDGVLGRPKMVDEGLEMRYKRQRTALVEGPTDRLAVLEETLLAAERLHPDDLKESLLPKDLDAFEAHVADRASEVAQLLTEGRALVEAAERLVCSLFEVPEALEEEVVAHAVDRAGSAVSPEDDQAD